MRSPRAWFGCALVAVVFLVLLPDPRPLASASTVGFAELLDPSLRVPFAAVLLGAQDAVLRPGERVLSLQLPGDTGVVAPRDRSELLRTVAKLRVGEVVLACVRGPHGSRSVELRVATTRAAHALAEQWPALLAASALLLFALACVLGGQHPVATPLFAVALCLGTALGAAVGLAMPGDAGLVGLSNLRARLGVLAWCALPAALLHLAARFPVVVPRFRRRALATLPYALWAVPALVAQLRFGEPAAVDGVERLALAASFLAGAILVAACAFPGRRLSPVERARARAAMAAFVLAGAGPLVVFVSGVQPPPNGSALLALGGLALPLALGWAVVRYRLLDPPAWLRHGVVSAAAAFIALLLAAITTGAAWQAAGAARDFAPVHGAALALVTALIYQAFHSVATRLTRGRLVASAAPEALLARAGRELAGARHPDEVLARLALLIGQELRAGVVEAFFVREGAPHSTLAERGLELWRSAEPEPTHGIVRPSRSEDPDMLRPELVVALAPRASQPALMVIAPRSDGLPYAPEELRAIEDVALLATLALGDATASAQLESCVAARTEALSRALDDRSAVLEAAARVQAAARGAQVRAAATAFLARCTGRRPLERATVLSDLHTVRLALDVEPARSIWLAVGDLAPERAADLQPQADAVSALANVALERIHLLSGLKQEVAQQARELARIASGQRCAEFVRGVAHELRKPTEEIRHLARSIENTVDPASRPALRRIEAITHELGRRLDCLLSRGGRRLDLRRVDLVRLVDDATARVARLRSERQFTVEHALPRLPLVGDPVRIASLVENLLDNAVKATAQGGAVQVRTALASHDAAPGPRVAIEVEDDGIGIPPDLFADIFEPGVGRFRSGFGLGLALCRDVVSAHGGSLTAESAPGRTVFRMLLPQLGPSEETS
jgi:signal transduction histidine kinase